MLDIQDADIGGARVRRTFSTIRANGERVQLKANDYLTAAEVLSIPIANRRALSDSNFIEVFPKSVKADLPQMDRFLVAAEKNRFNVIEGYLLNDTPLSREQAEKLLRQ